MLERVWRKGYTVGGNVNWYSHYGEQYGGSLKNKKQNYHVTQQSHYWAYTLRKENLCSHKTCPLMFRVALFVLGKRLNQPSCSSAGEWINWGSSMHGILLSHKKEWTVWFIQQLDWILLFKALCWVNTVSKGCILYSTFLKRQFWGNSLVVQWLRIHLPVEGMRVRSLVGVLRSHMLWGN